MERRNVIQKVKFFFERKTFKVECFEIQYDHEKNTGISSQSLSWP